jgi:hypothetical protein
MRRSRRRSSSAAAGVRNQRAAVLTLFYSASICLAAADEPNSNDSSNNDCPDRGKSAFTAAIVPDTQTTALSVGLLHSLPGVRVVTWSHGPYGYRQLNRVLTCRKTVAQSANPTGGWCSGTR